ncbi:MAG: lambda exonuclease family protein [Telluria sp.]
MQMTFHEQHTPEWKRERCGHATASRFYDVLGTKSGRQSYLEQLVCERVTGEPKPEAFSHSMDWGHTCEEPAKQLYQLLTGETVQRAGFVKHPTLPWVGASPDGLIGDDGGIEVKCPYNSEIHLRTWLEGMPVEHKAQVQGVMWVCERDWIDFISFDPRQPEHLRLYVERIHRDEQFIQTLAEENRKLLIEVALQVKKLHQLGKDAMARYGLSANDTIIQGEAA